MEVLDLDIPMDLIWEDNLSTKDDFISEYSTELFADFDGNKSAFNKIIIAHKLFPTNLISQFQNATPMMTSNPSTHPNL